MQAVITIPSQKTNELAIWIPCNPPKSWGKNSKTGFVVGGRAIITESKLIKSTKGWLCGVLAEYVPAKPFEGPVRLTMSVKYPYPASTPKKLRLGETWHSKRPDLDGVVTTVQDVLQTMRFVHDDAQFTEVLAAKHRSADPGIVITLETL